ncbi:MAG TPA: glycosyltransferase family 39 protein [Verrucomicrobiae bacterium]|jgi:hypothetical protein
MENQPEIAETGRAALFRAYLFLFSFLIVTSWILSCFHALNWSFIFAIVGVIATIFLLKNWGGSFGGIARGVAEPAAFWPFLLLATLLFITALTYPPTMLDSLTYRLPRMWLWEQSGYVNYIHCADARLDYMPQGWELATLPLIQLTGDKFVWLWSFVSWVMLYLVAYEWAFKLSGDQKKARYMAFIAVASSFAVLQARSSATDLVGTTMVALALHFILRFEKTRQWKEINWAILSFCLATNIKPHFAVMGVVLIIWFFASPSKPWRAFHWLWSPALLALWLACSAVPGFALNQKHFGTWAGPGQDYSMKGDNSFLNVASGSVMIFWQSVQPPINPLAPFINPPLLHATETWNIKKYVPRFVLKIPTVQMVDNASFGLVTVALLIAGLVLAFKGRPQKTSWPVVVATGALFATVLTLTHFVSGAAGRAYYGFVFLAIPLAMTGWNLFSPRALRYGLYFSLASSVLALIFDPSKPLWPVTTAERVIAKWPALAPVDRGLKSYLLVPERAHSGEDLLNAIPPNSQAIAALIGEDKPLLPLFRPYNLNRRIELPPPHITLQDLKALRVDYLIVGPMAEFFYPEIYNYLKTSREYEAALSHQYTCKLSCGAETWTLYRRVGSTGTVSQTNQNSQVCRARQ